MSFLKRSIISILIFIICLFVGEMILSSYITFPSNYFVATPNSGFVWKKDSLIKGINEDAHVSFDQFGSRSISDYKKKKKGIVAIGGSTTACYSLTQENTWTAIIEKKLSKDFWLGNFGKPSNHSFHHVQQLEQILKYPDLPSIKTVIVLMGVNDFSACLIDQKRYASLEDYEIKLAAFKHLPDHELPWYRRLTITKLLKRTKQNIKQAFMKDTYGQLLKKHSQIRQESEKIDILPNLDLGLQVYEQNILKIIDIAQTHEVNIVFVSQAVLWHKDLSEDEEKLLFANKTEDGIHYTTEVLAEGMSLFNKQLENICKRKNILFIDAKLESNSANFYDDCHYTESGSEKLAEQIFTELQREGLTQ